MENNMNTAKAKLFFLRCSPQKVMLVADLIRNKKTSEALVLLKHCRKKVAENIIKLLKSCINNAVNNHKLNAEHLYVNEIIVRKGTMLKRMRPRAKGRSDRIQKRCSNIEITVKEEIK